MRCCSGGPDWTEPQLRDVRRTGVVALAEAGCTIPEIAAISGHDIEECERIVNTYLPRTVPRWPRQPSANGTAS